jgi:ATP-dependent DNA helicase RecQ
VRETEGKGIVYAATVKAAEEMYALLEEQGESVTIYHGKLPPPSARPTRTCS